MSNKLTVLSIIVAGFIFAAMMPSEAQAKKKAPLITFGGEKIVKVKDLPNDPFYKHPTYGKVDLGYKIKQVKILFIPVWNYDGEYVGYVGRDDLFIRLDAAVKARMEKDGVKLSGAPSLPFWEKIGGKLVFILVIGGLIVAGLFMNKKEKKGKKDKKSDEAAA